LRLVSRSEEDQTDQKRMSFFEHLEELRDRFKIVFVVLVVLFGVFMTFGIGSVNIGGTQVPMLLPAFSQDPGPVSSQLFRSLLAFLVPSWVQVSTAHPWDGVVAQVESAVFLAAVVGSPVILYEVMAFIGPALKPSEKRILRRLLAPVTVLFFAGVALDLLILLPFTIRFLYAQQRGLGITLPQIFVGDFISFVLFHVLAFGVAFELPVIMYGLTSVGIVRAASWTRYWRFIIIGIWFIAGMITPDPSGVTMIIVGLILTGLYLLGVGAARHAERVRQAKAHPESKGMKSSMTGTRGT
jgi:sec-independent protein translocase protein TatC